MKSTKLKIMAVAAFTATFLFSCNQDSSIPMEEESQAVQEAPADASLIPGQYIVVFNQDVTGNESRQMSSYSRSQEFVQSKTVFSVCINYMIHYFMR